ncbi:hypothetical protein [Gordonia sp. i37]|uniref:hypothetical protein n=1 Tax=Gordonia sp. i37 TaxID=1961707 RepID=UPI00111B2E8F|nr:hypothetical protein [Gordonia sp. i37]
MLVIAAVVLVGLWLAGPAKPRPLVVDGDRGRVTDDERRWAEAFRGVDWSDPRFGGALAVKQGAGESIVTPMPVRAWVTPTGVRVELAFDPPLTASDLTAERARVLGALLPGDEAVSVVSTTRRTAVVELGSRDPLMPRAVEW